MEIAGTKTMQKETRKIVVGEALGYHMVYRQAGSLEKALAEYFMNSADSHSTVAELELEANSTV
jgi:hypothetical protein